MSLEMVDNLVVKAAESGARYVFTVMEPIMCKAQTIAKVQCFYQSGLKVRKQLQNRP
jgi:hypothetical protein